MLPLNLIVLENELLVPPINTASQVVPQNDWNNIQKFQLLQGNVDKLLLNYQQ